MALFLATACGATPPGSSAPPGLPYGVRAHAEQRTYPVAGLTQEDILRDLTTAGPAATGSEAWGQHRWNIQWTFRTRDAGGYCQVVRAEVVLQTVTILPEWVDRDRASTSLAGEWARFIGALRAHENGHRDISYRAAGDIHRELLRTRSPTCSTLSLHANQAAHAVVRKANERDRAYDEASRHGAMQGAYWPLPKAPQISRPIRWERPEPR